MVLTVKGVAALQATMIAKRLCSSLVEFVAVARQFDRRRSVLLIERRLAALVGQLLADVCYLCAHLEHDPLDAAADRKITTRRTARRQARQCRQGDTGNAIDQCIDIRLSHQLLPLLHQQQLQDLGLDLDVISVGLTAWRLPPQVSQIGNASLVERKAVTLPLDHAFGFELADGGPAAIEVQRQCRRADGCGLSGSRSRDRLGDRRAIIRRWKSRLLRP